MEVGEIVEVVVDFVVDVGDVDVEVVVEEEVVVDVFVVLFVEQETNRMVPINKTLTNPKILFIYPPPNLNTGSLLNFLTKRTIT